MTVPDSHATMLEVLGMNATQVDPFALQNLMATIADGTQIATTVVDLDGSPVVTIPK
jgi:ligand-binding sensor protein